MEPLAYLSLQMRLEGMKAIDECFIRQVEVVPDENVPLMLIAQLANQEPVVYYDESISPALQRNLAERLLGVAFPEIQPLLEILKTEHIPFEVGHYKTYVFPLAPLNDNDVLCLSKHDTRVKSFRFDGFADPVFALEQGGMLVSACVSTRENEACGEGWVYTAPDFRGHGLAEKVVSAWAGSLMSTGKVPFYSHKPENVASANLARKLGLQNVFEEISITQI